MAHTTPPHVRADTTLRRLTGLMLRRRPPDGAGLLLRPCRSVHTIGMRYALDLVWLAADGTILRIDEAVPPLRLRTCRHAHAVLELPSGEAARHGLGRGAHLRQAC